MEAPLTGFNGDDFEETPTPPTVFDVGDLAEPLRVFGEEDDFERPVRVGLGSVATAKIRLVRFPTRILSGTNE